MIYAQESIIGLSLYEAMMRLTGGRDPKDYFCSIELNPRQRIGVGREYRRHARAYVPVRRNLPEQSDARRKYLEERGSVEREWSTLGKVIECDGKIEKKAADECAELIRPLFVDLAAGKLQVQCRDMVAPLSTPVPVPPDFWEGPWDLVLKDGDTTLTVKSAAQGKISGRFGIVGKYRLLKIQSATAQAELQAPPAALARETLGAIGELRTLSAGDALKRQRKRNGGPKPTYDWAAAECAVGARLHADGVPEPGDGGQALLEKFMADWFSENGPLGADGERKTPSESLIRDHVDRVLTEHRKALL